MTGSVSMRGPSPLKIRWFKKFEQFCSSVPEVVFQGQYAGSSMPERFGVPVIRSTPACVSTARLTREKFENGIME